MSVSAAASSGGAGAAAAAAAAVATATSSAGAPDQANAGSWYVGEMLMTRNMLAGMLWVGNDAGVIVGGKELRACIAGIYLSMLLISRN